jgi:hypothetical protein
MLRARASVRRRSKKNLPNGRVTINITIDLFLDIFRTLPHLPVGKNRSLLP